MHSISVIGKEPKVYFTLDTRYIPTNYYYYYGLSIVQKLQVGCDALKVIWFGIKSDY